MKVKLITIGKTTTPYLRQGEEYYTKRLSHYTQYERLELADVRAGKWATEARQKELEGQAMLAQVKPGDILVLLDERGLELTSRQMAEWVQKRMATGASKNLIFAIGGPYGFSPSVYERADFKLSLSRLTFPHELVRVFFLEQLYRCFTILNGEPYHHD